MVPMLWGQGPDGPSPAGSGARWTKTCRHKASRTGLPILRILLHPASQTLPDLEGNNTQLGQFLSGFACGRVQVPWTYDLSGLANDRPQCAQGTLYFGK